MIAILLIASTFMIIILLAVFFFAVQVRKWSLYREEEQMKRFEEYKERADADKNEILREVKNLLSGVHQLLNNASAN